MVKNLRGGAQACDLRSTLALPVSPYTVTVDSAVKVFHCLLTPFSLQCKTNSFPLLSDHWFWFPPSPSLAGSPSGSWKICQFKRVSNIITISSPHGKRRDRDIFDLTDHQMEESINMWFQFYHRMHQNHTIVVCR